MKRVLIAVGIVVVVLGAAIAFAYSGLYNVAATASEPDAIEWLLKATRERSVRLQAEGIAVPDLSPEARVGAGAAAYREMCAACHGAPGQSPVVGARDMSPPPPDLARLAAERSPAELFWVVKHGIRMTGMPAWGPTHTDAELWDLVAFMRRLPGLSAAAYGQLAEGGEAHGHDPDETGRASAHEHGHERNRPRH